MRKVGVAILGLGTVGGGTYEILVKNREHIKNVYNVDAEVKAVLEINKQRALSLGISEKDIYSNIAEIVANPEVDIIVEVIGGIEPARSFIIDALSAGKTVVTANKELISKHWCELELIAKQHGAGFYFEASCVGGVPIIRALTQSVQANRIQSLVGIINGTTNFILSKMANEGMEYADVLKEAQVNGFAEANPTADVEGFDASYKLSILASLAFAKKVPLENIYREGISGIDARDIAYGKELGYVLKLLAIGKETDAGVEARVHPTFIKNTNPLASVDGSFNAVMLTGDAVGDVMFYGKGAGALPTGSAIVSDVIFAASQNEHFYVSFDNSVEGGKKTKNVSNFSSEYYVRLSVEDKAGVLSKVAGIFGREGVSIVEVMQKPKSAQSDLVPIILITHKTFENSMKTAIERLKKQSYVDSVDALIRVES